MAGVQRARNGRNDKKKPSQQRDRRGRPAAAGQGKTKIEKVNKHPNRSTKNKIRGVERLLKKTDLPPAQRKIQEALLASLHKELEAHKRAEKERKFAIMYKKVRLTERVKITRRLAKAKKALATAEASGEDVSDDIRQRVAQATADLEYVLNFPKGEKYVSLLLDPEDEAEKERVERERRRLRAMVRAALADQAATVEADETLAMEADDAEDAAEVEAVEHDDFFADDDDAPPQPLGKRQRHEPQAGGPSNEDMDAKAVKGDSDDSGDARVGSASAAEGADGGAASTQHLSTPTHLGVEEGEESDEDAFVIKRSAAAKVKSPASQRRRSGHSNVDRDKVPRDGVAHSRVGGRVSKRTSAAAPRVPRGSKPRTADARHRNSSGARTGSSPKNKSQQIQKVQRGKAKAPSDHSPAAKRAKGTTAGAKEAAGRPKQAQPVRTRAEGGRKRRKKHK